MKKQPIFGKIILILQVIVLLVIAVFVVQIKLSMSYSNEKSLIQKIKANFPTIVKMNQKIISKDNIEITFIDKNISDKITAPVNYYGFENNYKASSSNNTLFYFRANVMSLYKRNEDLDNLIKTKIIATQKYEFDCTTLKETKERNDFIKSIYLMPLEKDTVYFVCEIPKLFTKAKNNLSLDITTMSNHFVLPIK